MDGKNLLITDSISNSCVGYVHLHKGGIELWIVNEIDLFFYESIHVYLVEILFMLWRFYIFTSLRLFSLMN